MTEEQIRRKILLCTGGKEAYEIASWSKAERDVMIRKLRDEGLSGKLNEQQGYHGA